MAAPGIDGRIGRQDDIPAILPPMQMRGPHRPFRDAGPAQNVSLSSTAPGRCSSGDELFLSGFPPKLQIPIALVDNHDPGFVERGGAQLEDKFRHFLAVSARDLGAAGPNILGEDGEGDAQGRLPEGVHLIDVGAFADQEFNDVRQSLIGRPVQRGPAVLSGGCCADAVETANTAAKAAAVMIRIVLMSVLPMG